MTTATTDVTLPSRATEALSAFFAREDVRILMVVLPLLALWGVAIATWGYPALIVPALALVPTMFTVLMLITVGK